MVKTKIRIKKATVYFATVEFNSLTEKWEVNENGKVSYFTFFRSAMKRLNQIIAREESCKA